MNSPDQLTPIGQILLVAGAMLVLAGTIRLAQRRLQRQRVAAKAAPRRRKIEHVVIIADERAACRDRHPSRSSR